jgi:short-subunit dehydrogenase
MRHYVVTMKKDIQWLKNKAVSKNNEVEYLQLELSSLLSVRIFEDDFRKKGPLHLLINNAGKLSKLLPIIIRNDVYSNSQIH